MILKKFQFVERLAADGDLSPLERRLGVRLASLFNVRRGFAWPSYQRLAEELGVSRRSVIRAVRCLEDRGYIRIGRGGGRGNANTYVIVLDWRGCPFALARERNSDANVTVSRKRVTRKAQNGDNGVTPSYLRPNLSDKTVSVDPDATSIESLLRADAHPAAILKTLENFAKRGGRLRGALAHRVREWLDELAEDRMDSPLAGWAFRLLEEQADLWPVWGEEDEEPACEEEIPL